jgi:hypothetical protein
VFAQHQLGTTNAKLGRGRVANIRRDRAQVFKKRLHMREQSLACLGQSEGTALKQFCADVLLELAHLPTHGRLLNAVGDVPHRRANPTVLRHVIKQFEVVDIHRDSRSSRRSSPRAMPIPQRPPRPSPETISPIRFIE